MPFQHGESKQNLQGRIGGDSDLSERGEKYAAALGAYITEQNVSDNYIKINLKIKYSEVENLIEITDLLFCTYHTF